MRLNPSRCGGKFRMHQSRKNHLTIVESWDSLSAKHAWISTPAARSFREELQPMSGSLYDERAYMLLRQG
jgi:hypothetical protein